MSDSHPPNPTVSGSGGVEASGGIAQASPTATETVGLKRQRRPSVRLGDIGGDHFNDIYSRRTGTYTHKQLKNNYHNNNNNSHNQLSLGTKKDGNGLSTKGSSRTRALTNLSTAGEIVETLDSEREGNLDSVAIGSWKVKDSKKKGIGNVTKRLRSKWVYPNSKIDEEGGGVADGGDRDEEEDKCSGSEDDAEIEIEMENCESPLKESSPVNSVENAGVGNERRKKEINSHSRKEIRGRDWGNSGGGDGVELSGPSDNEGIGCGNNDRLGGGEDGVRIWLNSIGLGRYAPVFQVHQVDDEVLPLLTLEDLKDMGITAVGSRRKMFSAIQKLSEGGFP